MLIFTNYSFIEYQLSSLLIALGAISPAFTSRRSSLALSVDSPRLTQFHSAISLIYT